MAKTVFFLRHSVVNYTYSYYSGTRLTRSVRSDRTNVRRTFCRREGAALSALSGMPSRRPMVRWGLTVSSSDTALGQSRAALITDVPAALAVQCVSKNSHCHCLYLREILVDFDSSSTGTFDKQLAIRWLLNIPPPLNCVATLPCKIYMFKNHHA